MNPRYIKIAAGLLAVLLGSWLFATPYLAYRGMHAAAQVGDAEKLSGYIDYPVLRENLKATLNAKLLGRASAESSGNLFAGLGAALASVVVGPMVESSMKPTARIAVPAIGKGL